MSRVSRYLLNLFIFVSCLFFQANYTHADTQIIQQLLTDGTTTTSDHWGTKFVAPTSTVVQSIALGVSAPCNNTVKLGHVETLPSPDQFVGEGVFSTASPIPGGYRFTGASVPIVGGRTYYILHGPHAFPCSVFDLSRTQLSSLPQNAQIFHISAYGYWFSLDASEYGSPIRDIVDSISPDTKFTLNPPPH